jgi:RNA polymerase sigma factor (sigma-70 family)
MEYSRRIEVFTKVKDQYLRLVTAVLWKLTGDRQLFEEAMQYTLLGMWQHVEKLDGDKAPFYIYRIALSANSKAWHDRVAKNGDQVPDWAAVDKSPEDKAGQAELVGMVRRAIAQLPESQSKAIVMRYLEQREYGQIAQTLGCSEVASRSHVCKALASLRTRLRGLLDEE